MNWSVVPPTQPSQTPQASHLQSLAPSSSIPPTCTQLCDVPHRNLHLNNYGLATAGTATATITTDDHHQQIHHPQKIPISDLTCTSTRTFVITPPLSNAKTVHVSFNDPLLVAASSSDLSVYDVDVEPPTTSISTRPPAFLVANWPSPPDHSIAAVALSPDATVLAAIIHDNAATSGETYTSAVVLLDPRTCTRLIRLALPHSFSFSCQLCPSPPLSFISSDQEAQHPDTSSPSHALPQKLKTILLNYDRSNRTAKSSVSAAATTAWGDVAPWSLAVTPSSITSLSESIAAQTLVISFRRGFRRIQQMTHVLHPPQQNQDLRPKEPLQARVLRRLDPTGGYTLGFYTARSAFCLVNTSSIDRIVARADIPLHSLIATFCNKTNSGGCVIASCSRANGKLGLAVIDDLDVQLVGTAVDMDNVRHVQLVNVSGFQPIVVVVSRNGFPIVIGGISFNRKLGGVPVVSTTETSSKHRNSDDGELTGNIVDGNPIDDDDGLGCEDCTQVDVTVSGDSIIAAYTKDSQVVLRVTTVNLAQ